MLAGSFWTLCLCLIVAHCPLVVHRTRTAWTTSARKSWCRHCCDVLQNTMWSQLVTCFILLFIQFSWRVAARVQVHYHLLLSHLHCIITCYHLDINISFLSPLLWQCTPHRQFSDRNNQQELKLHSAVCSSLYSTLLKRIAFTWKNKKLRFLIIIIYFLVCFFE